MAQDFPIGDIIAALAGLGTAAYGLVDASKALWGGPSNVGFPHIRKTLQPFAPALAFVGSGAFFATLRANWMNGVALDEQKAKAKALIHLGLNAENAKTMAKASGVDQAALIQACQKIDNGTELSVDDVNIIGRFDAILSAKLDAAFERADQAYRNTAKLVACFVAVVLAVVVNLSLGNLVSWEVAALVGLISTPLAPIAKDLASSLTAAAAALSSIKR